MVQLGIEQTVLFMQALSILRCILHLIFPQYMSLDELEQDLLQMFHNACVYNEPDSQIYKDALTLQRAMIRKRQELTDDDSSHVSDVQFLVQGLLYALYSNLVNHRDEEGRCFSDSLMEIVSEVGCVHGDRTCR